MANRNTRALTLKKNAKELEDKLSDIKRLIGGLEGFVNEIIASMNPFEWNMIEASDIVDKGIEVRVLYEFTKRRLPVKIGLWQGENMLKKDSQFNLDTVRRVHNNLDVLIECAENICEDAGRLAEFQAKMKRFEV